MAFILPRTASINRIPLALRLLIKLLWSSISMRLVIESSRGISTEMGSTRHRLPNSLHPPASVNLHQRSSNSSLTVVKEPKINMELATTHLPAPTSLFTKTTTLMVSPILLGVVRTCHLLVRVRTTVQTLIVSTAHNSPLDAIRSLATTMRLSAGAVEDVDRHRALTILPRSILSATLLSFLNLNRDLDLGFSHARSC